MGTEQLVLEQISKLQGSYPDLALPSDVERVDGDFFVTLPIGKIDTRSRNGRVYTEAAWRKVVQEINTKRPEGTWGHVPAAERGTRYDTPAIRWLAAHLDEQTGVLWGKLTPLTEQAKEYYRQAKRHNARVGTSLTGSATLDGDKVIDIDLTSIDMADPARVGIPETAARPQITTEMQEQEEPSMDLAQLQAQITEMTGKIAGMESAVKLVNEMRQVLPGTDLVTEMKTVIKERDDLKAESAALKAEQMKGKVQAVITEMVKLPDLRQVVTELLGTVADEAEAKTKIDEILKRPHMQKMAQALVTEQAGPAAITGVVTDPSKVKKVEDTPEAREKASREFSFQV